MARLASQPRHPHVDSALSRHDNAHHSYFVFPPLRQRHPLDRHLFDELNVGLNGSGMPAATARNHLAQILSGLRHMHWLGVAHRDINPESIDISQQGVIRLNLAESVTLPTQMPPEPLFDTQSNAEVGLVSHMPPEMLPTGPGGPDYDMFKADVWSLGVVLFVMSTGSRFFDRADLNDPGFWCAHVAQQNGLKTVDAIYTRWGWHNPLNDDLVALLDGMLRINPAERMTLDEVCKSPWVRESQIIEGATFSAVGATIFAHDDVVPLALVEAHGNMVPLAGRLRALSRWARVRRLPFIRKALVDSLNRVSGIRPAEPDAPAGAAVLAAQAEFEETAPVHDSLPDALGHPAYKSLAASAGDGYRGLAAPSSPSHWGFGARVPVVKTLEELEAAMEKAGVPRLEPLPLTRQKPARKPKRQKSVRA